MNLFIFVPVWVFQLGVPGVDTDRVSAFVMEGDSVTLNTNVKTNEQEKIKWFFNDTRIAQISDYLSKTCTDVQCNEGTERFRDRLKLDHQTGSLTITNISNTDSGEYKLKIFSSSSTSDKIFNVTFHDVPDEVKRKSLKEGESVTLDSAIAKKQNDSMTWYFNDILIAEITGDQSKICTDDQCDERFRDRLKLDHQTGSLNITNTRTTDSGEYKLQMMISNSNFNITRVKRFSVTVTAVPDSGLSPGAVAGIVVAVFVAVLVAVVGVIYHSRSHTAVSQNDDNL